MIAQAPSTPDLDVRTHGRITIIAFRDRRLIDTARIEALGRQIMELAGENPIPGSANLIISFAKVEYLSSTMLSVLLNIDKAMRQRRGRVILADLDPELRQVFDLMKLQKALTICDTTSDALSAFVN